MPLLTGLTLPLLCQTAGEAPARLAHWPLPDPVLGLVLMVLLLRWPSARGPVQAAATPLLAHLSLLFVPVGVGVVAHLGLVSQYGPRMLAALLLSTWIGSLVAALVLRGPAVVALAWPLWQRRAELRRRAGVLLLAALAAVFAVLTGLIGAVTAQGLLRVVQVRHPALQGFALGTVAHGIGAARALQVHPEAGAYAALALGVQVLLAALLLPLAARLF